MNQPEKIFDAIQSNVWLRDLRATLGRLSKLDNKATNFSLNLIKLEIYMASSLHMSHWSSNKDINGGSCTRPGIWAPDMFV